MRPPRHPVLASCHPHHYYCHRLLLTTPKLWYLLPQPLRHPLLLLLLPQASPHGCPRPSQGSVPLQAAGRETCICTPGGHCPASTKSLACWQHGPSSHLQPACRRDGTITALPLSGAVQLCRYCMSAPRPHPRPVHTCLTTIPLQTCLSNKGSTHPVPALAWSAGHQQPLWLPGS